jgi:hypothetical protein
MSTWIAQHFLNPAFFWSGAALISVPIIIHLINRLHYRRVRFAAMEFLLASEQKSRRRILLEQMLLLLLRILMVLLLLALVGRLVLSASQLSLFQGAKSHHLVLLDDSGSMRDRVGETSAFEEAKSIIRKLVAEGANRPGTQKFTLLLASRPDETIAGLSERDIDEVLVDEVSTRLEDLECTHQSPDLAVALEAAKSRLVDDRTDLKHLHVISDFRRGNWFDNKSLAATLKALDQAKVAINLVRTVADAHENLALTDLSGAVEVAAAGVPVTLNVKVSNFGTRAAEGVRVGVAVDGRQVAMNLVFDSIGPGQEVERPFEITFDTAGKHRVQVSLESDPLEQDNFRYLAVEVPEENPVLIIDGAPGGEQGTYIADALAADKSVTGFATVVDGPDHLRKSPLERFHLIYLVNVPELQADGLDALEKFVAAGGGLVWFMGDAVRPAYYNDKLFRDGTGLFPARLGGAPAHLPRDPSQTTGADIAASNHSLFHILSGEQNPFVDVVFVNEYYPLDRQWLAEQLPGSINVKLVASLRDRSPLVLEHTYGKGRVVTCLTSAGPLLTPEGEQWNNWANGPAAPSYAVFQLDLAKYVARSDRTLPRRTVGESIGETFSRTLYQDTVEFISPDDQVTQIKAIELPADEEISTAGAAPTVRPLSVTFRDTDAPGIYGVRLTTQDRQPIEKLVAYNVPVEEGQLMLVTDEQIRKATGPLQQLTIQPAGAFGWIRSESPGEDIRWFVLTLLIVFGVCEQAMAYRLSYHPR